MPFSDPLADGPTIQRSTFQALQQGMTLAGTLELIERCRAARGRSWSSAISTRSCATASIVSARRRGARRRRSAAHRPAGGQRSRPWSARCSGAALDLIRLIAPTTRPERLAAAVDGAQGFVYLVARLGVTGASAPSPRTSPTRSSGCAGRPGCPWRSASASPPRSRRGPSLDWPTAWSWAARWWTPSARDGVAGGAALSARAPGRARPRPGGGVA